MSDVNFQLSLEPIHCVGKVVPTKKAIVVDGSDVINVVSNKYKIVQPSQVLETFKATTGLEVTKMKTNRNTGGILLGATVNKDTDYQHDLVFYTGHNGKYSTILTLQTLRVACMNQCSTLLGNTSQHLLNVKHYENLDFQKLGQLLEIIPTATADFHKSMDMLQLRKLTLKDFIELYVANKKLADKKCIDKKVNEITEIYIGAQGQALITGDSAFKAFNAITYMNTHLTNSKSKNALEYQAIDNVKDSDNWYNIILNAAA